MTSSEGEGAQGREDGGWLAAGSRAEGAWSVKSEGMSDQISASPWTHNGGLAGLGMAILRIRPPFFVRIRDSEKGFDGKIVILIRARNPLGGLKTHLIG